MCSPMLNKSIFHLKRIPLFASVPDNELEIINRQLQEVSFSAGSVIIREEDLGDCLYLIRKGRVKVVSIADNEEEIVLASLGEGDYFGEMSLITGEPRSATVIAEGDVELWRLSKKEFDLLILNHPVITLSLTHMLSQRLKMSNIARESSERFLKHQIRPGGDLQDVGVIKLLKFAEDNSLTGRISLKNEDKHAYFFYEKGQLVRLNYQEKNENEAMDEIMEWTSGAFQIEPSLYQMEDLLVRGKTVGKAEPRSLSSFIEEYLAEKFAEFIQFAGSRPTQSAINKAFHKFGKYFDVTTDFVIRTMPELTVRLFAQNSLSEKHHLFLAVLMRDITNTIERDVVGMDFWDNRSQKPEINTALESVHFFEYFDQALDFIRD